MNGNWGSMPQQSMMGMGMGMGNNMNMMMGKGNANFAAQQPSMPLMDVNSAEQAGDDLHSKLALTGFNKPSTPTGQVLNGTIKSFNADNGYGFITCDEVRMAY